MVLRFFFYLFFLKKGTNPTTKTEPKYFSSLIYLALPSGRDKLKPAAFRLSFLGKARSPGGFLLWLSPIITAVSRYS